MNHCNIITLQITLKNCCVLPSNTSNLHENFHSHTALVIKHNLHTGLLWMIHKKSYLQASPITY